MWKVLFREVSCAKKSDSQTEPAIIIHKNVSDVSSMDNDLKGFRTYIFRVNKLLFTSCQSLKKKS